jgi:hypothetical protein
MVNYFLNLLPRLQRHSHKLDQSEAFIDKPWIMIQETGNEKLVFRRNGDLLMVKNGIVNVGKWEYIEPLDALLIDRVKDRLLLKYAFINQFVMLLKLDDTNSDGLIPFVNEHELPSLDYKTYLNQLSESNSSLPNTISCNFEVGSNVGGGVIFNIDEQTRKYFVVSKHNLEICTWSKHWLQMNIQASATSLVDGKFNTKQIISVLGDKGKYAAKISADYDGGGFNDWFLPAKEQLNKLWEIRSQWNSYDLNFNKIYWSSTENSISSAWAQGIYDNYKPNQRVLDKYNRVFVRPIREIDF